MKIYVKYITKNLLTYISITTIIVTLIVWLSQSIKYLNLITNSGIDFASFLGLSILLIPSYVQVLLPIASFIGVIFYYHKLFIDNELSILRNSGLSNFQLYKPALYAGLIFTLINYLLSFYIMPLSAKNFKKNIANFRDNYVNLLLEEKTFNSKIKNLTIYIEKLLPNNVFQNILIYDTHDQNKETTIIAEYGKISKDNGLIKFKFLKGSRQEKNKNGKFSILDFDSLNYNITIEDKYQLTNSYDPQEKYINELLYSIKNDRSNKFILELNQRITWPIYNILMILLALNIFESQQIKKNFTFNIFFASIISIIFIILYFLMYKMAIHNIKIIIYIYIEIVSIIIVNIYILFCRKCDIKHFK